MIVQGTPSCLKHICYGRMKCVMKHTGGLCLGVRDAAVHPVLRTRDDLITRDLSRRGGAALHAALEVIRTITVVAGVRGATLGTAQGGLHAGATSVGGLARGVVAALDVIVARAQISGVKGARTASRRSAYANTFHAVRVT